MFETPRIETPRLILRPLALSDAAAIQSHFNNWNVIKTLATVVPWPYPGDGAESFIRRELDKIAAGEESYQWALVLRARDGEAIGNINFRPRADGRKGNRGFWLAEPYWNQGLMTEAIAAVNDFAFLALGLDHFHVCNAPSNVGSRPGQAEDRSRIRRLRRASAPQWRIQSGEVEGDARDLVARSREAVTLFANTAARKIAAA
ncbi:ribosomal-protein-alanine N-acetyltransferase [Bradyrhizobium sp. USDA 4518]